MALTAARIFILYILANLAVRIMGKRQIGELQPAELVVTFLLSEIAAIPMQDNDIPVLNSIVAIMLLVSFEIISSVISMKSKKIRTALDGNPILIIKNGSLDEKAMKKLRLTVDDVLSALRQKDVFDISSVSYAFVETNGSLSVLLKNEENPLTAKALKLKTDASALTCPVIADGKYIREYYNECGMTDKKIGLILKNQNIKIDDVLLMTAQQGGKTNIIKKRG